MKSTYFIIKNVLFYSKRFAISLSFEFEWYDLFKGLRLTHFSTCASLRDVFEWFDLFKGLVVKLTSMSILLREFCYAKHRRGDNVMAHPGAMRGYVRLVTFLPSMWRDLFKGLRRHYHNNLSFPIFKFEWFDLFKGLVVRLTSMSILLREFCYAKHRRGIMWWHIQVPCVDM